MENYGCGLFFLNGLLLFVSFIYGVGDIPIIAIVCAAAYQEPAEMAAPCEAANNPPAIGPVAYNPATNFKN